MTNLTGHKLPTAYPSRRAWLHVVVRDRAGRSVFESGALTPAGRSSATTTTTIGSGSSRTTARSRSPDQVQIYESIMRDAYGAVTTGLLSGLDYAKDSRILPSGFDKRTASRDIAVARRCRERSCVRRRLASDSLHPRRHAGRRALSDRSGALVSADQLSLGAEPPPATGSRDGPVRLVLRVDGRCFGHRARARQRYRAVMTRSSRVVYNARRNRVPLLPCSVARMLQSYHLHFIHSEHASPSA